MAEWNYAPEFPWLLGAGLLALFQAGLAWRHRRLLSARQFALLMCAVAIWSATGAVELCTTDLAAKILISKFQYLGVIAVAPLWLLFTHVFGRGRLPSPGVQAVVWGLPAVVLALTVTNEWHGWVWPRVYHESGMPPRYAIFEHGPAVYALMAYSYILLLIGTVTVITTALRSHGIYRRQTALLIAAAVLPWASNAIYLEGRFPLPGVDPTPFAFAITGLLMLWSFYRHQWLELTPLAHELIMAGMQDGLLVADERDHVVDTNPAALSLLPGVPSVIGADLCALIPELPAATPGSAPVRLDPLEVARGQPDKVRWLELRVSPIDPGGRQYRGRLVFMRDITDRKETARNQRASAAILSALAEFSHLTAPDDLRGSIVNALGHIGRAIDVDRAYVLENHTAPDGVLVMSQRFAWTSPTLARQRDNPGLQGLPYDAGLARWRDLLAAGQPLHGLVREFPESERRILEPLAIVSLLIVPIQLGGRLWGFIGFDDCRTERHWSPLEIGTLRMAAEAVGSALLRMVTVGHLRRAEFEQVRLATAIEQSAETIVITDAEGRIEYVNPAFEAITGYSRKEVMGKTPSILKSGKHEADFYKHLWSEIRVGRVWAGHIINRRKDGSEYEEEMTISPVFDESDRIVNFVAAKRDVTQEHRLEEQLRQAQRMESIGRLAGGVAHDFNNLLQAMLGAVELGRERAKRGEQASEEFDELQHLCGRATELTHQLLAFSRRQVLRIRTIDLNAQIAGLIKMLRRVIGEDITLTFQADATLPLVQADAAQLDQVFLNLCVNARDAMPGGGTLKLEARGIQLDAVACVTQGWGEPGHYALIRVSDTGCGIAPEKRKYIFEPFFTTKETGKGTGLGLATVHGIVRQHHGFIRFQTEVGRGTTFEILLPAAPPDVVAATAAAEISAPPPRGTETLLVAEDDELVRNMLVRTLQGAGYRVLPAADGLEAQKILKEQGPQVQFALLDVVMPRMGGAQVYDTIKASHPGLRVLFSTGHAAGELPPHLMAQQGLDLINKPYSSRDLLRKIREMLDRR